MTSNHQERLVSYVQLPQHTWSEDEEKDISHIWQGPLKKLRYAETINHAHMEHKQLAVSNLHHVCLELSTRHKKANWIEQLMPFKFKFDYDPHS